MLPSRHLLVLLGRDSSSNSWSAGVFRMPCSLEGGGLAKAKPGFLQRGRATEVLDWGWAGLRLAGQLQRVCDLERMGKLRYRRQKARPGILEVEPSSPANSGIQPPPRHPGSGRTRVAL